MNPEQRDRSAALYSQQMQQTNGSIPMGPPMPRRQRPNGGPVPGIQPVVRPTPPKVPPIARLTGPNPKIPKRMDPTNRYHNLPGGEISNEKMTGSLSKEESELGPVKQSLALVLLILVASSVFVIPREYRFFWMVIFGLSVVMCLGTRLYVDLYESSLTKADDDNEKDRLKTMAGVVLYAEYILFSFVMGAILLVLAWKLYGQLNSRSNLLSNTEPETPAQQAGMERQLQAPIQQQRAMMKAKRRKPKFI